MFSPMNSRSAGAYRQVGVQSGIESASPHQLVQMLFDGLFLALNTARGAMQREDVEEKGQQIGKAVRILEEGLKGGLNMAQGGELAANLRALYDFSISRLTQANLRNDVGMLEEVVKVLAPVAQGWKEIAATPEAAAA